YRPIQDLINQPDSSARGKLRDRDALWADVRVRIDVASLTPKCLHPLDESLVVDVQKLLFCHEPWLDRRERKACRGFGSFDRSMSCIEALRPLGVVSSGSMLEKPWVREE